VESANARLRPGGVYLLTGGLGGIGLAMAGYLARTVQARLVLVGRTGLPPREEWLQILASQGEDEGVGRRIRRVLELEAQGAEVLIVQADVTDEAQMQAAVEQALATFGTLHGVLHAAGVPGIGLIQLKTVEQTARVLAAKVQGTLVLERVLRDLPLDFLALFSSITSTTGGGPGQVDYCAANAFLDAYAHSCPRRDNAIAIDWGEWQWNAWENGLAGYGAEAQAYFKENRAHFGITFEEGAEAFQRVLASGLSHVVVSTQDFRAVAEQSKFFTASLVLQRTREQRRGIALHPRPDVTGSYISPGSDLERRIAALWEDVLGVTPVGIHDNFFELGGNSLIGLDLIARLRKMGNAVTLAAHVLYEAPTVSSLARYLEQDTTEEVVEERHERGRRRREGLKQLMYETRRMRM
jgi:NAD(P)-dependent dehydrogenase (short-subunit alcohol dehydrogenase family)/aryl carrier-like protein